LEVALLFVFLIQKKKWEDSTSVQSSILENRFNFGDEAIPALLRIFKKHGSNPKSLLVSVLGGGHNSTSSVKNVARSNIKCAHEWVKKYGLKISKEKTFSDHGVRIKMNTENGEIFISNASGGETSQSGQFDLIAIGSSTGGTEAIREIASRMKKNLPPIVIVQHLPGLFTKNFADSLNIHSQIIFKEAENGEYLRRGVAYIAPGGKQMKLVLGPLGIKIDINDDPEVNGFKPSVDYLFFSIDRFVKSKKIQAIILTGMGNDGAKGIKHLHRLGVATIAQDEGSSVVFGMPKAAIELKAINQVLSLDEIADIF
jgi:chemotaxis response regulator CheB